MFGFLNERTLEPFNNWENALQFFLQVALELAQSGTQFRLRRDDEFFHKPEFTQRFNHLKLARDTRALVQQLAFTPRYYEAWRPERMSSDVDVYACAEPVIDLQDESASEAAERKLCEAGLEILLFGAKDSAFGSVQPVHINRKASPQPIATLTNVSEIESLKKWLSRQRGYYDLDSPASPRDFQTVLEKVPRFSFTGKVERKFSRRVFLESSTGRFFYVDDGHPGRSAHLEVFSATYEHLGTAPIDSGILDTSTRVNGRKLRW